MLKVTERGWAGHFICSSECRFRRNTLIEYGEKRIVVSTVGNYKSPLDKKEPSTIGYNRYYETMAFEAKWEDPYWEAEVSKEVDFESDWSLNEIEHDTDQKANDMHEIVVKELTEKLILT